MLVELSKDELDSLIAQLTTVEEVRTSLPCTCMYPCTHTHQGSAHGRGAPVRAAASNELVLTVSSFGLT